MPDESVSGRASNKGRQGFSACLPLPRFTKLFELFTDPGPLPCYGVCPRSTLIIGEWPAACVPRNTWGVMTISSVAEFF